MQHKNSGSSMLEKNGKLENLHDQNNRGKISDTEPAVMWPFESHEKAIF